MKSQTWPIVALGSRTKFLSGGTPSKAEGRYWNGDIPWIGSGEMSEQRIEKTTHSVTSDGAQNGTRLVQRNTVLIVVRGMSLAKECRVSLTTRESTFNQDVKALDLNPEVDPFFVFYYLRSQKFRLRDAASEAAHGTKKLDTPVLEQWPFPNIPFVVQRKIAAILTAYDDLIATNKRRIALLEKMAEELYREWFVRMRFPGHQNTKFIKGIPEKWDMRKIEDAFEFTGGGTPSKKIPSYWSESDVNWFTPSDITGAAGIFLSDSGDQCSEEGLARSSAKMFPANSVMMTSRATIGAIGINRTPACTNQGFITCIPNKHYPLCYLYQWLKLAKPYFEQLCGGATFPELTKGTFKKIEIITPPEDLIQEFSGISEPIFEAIQSGLEQNENLTKTRDLLLPRLISGKLSVEDLDIQFPPSMQDHYGNP
ncbi:restriction endonuclease subunit S [Akkermansiaceae bacterium]|nr:restriction endonuclease subunit S [Akkermansiaceae bacterium]